MTSQDEIILLLTRAPLVLPVFLLVLFRVTGLMLTAPIYGSDAVPTRVRIGLSVAIAILVFPMAAQSVPANVTMSSAIPGIFGELAIGLIIGLTISLVFAGVQLAGMVIGQQAGLALGQVFNPVLNAETTVLGETFFMTALAVFVLVGGHRELVRALLDTYATVPVLSFRVSGNTLDLINEVLNSAYAVGLRMAAPVLLSLLIATLVMGFLSRTMPQLNILSVGFPVRTLLALCICGFVLAASGGVIVDAIGEVFEKLRLSWVL
ncbi:MAG: flagellar biosynthetic protein FliR [Phycisphaerales bacterium]|nr:flagellar biosynthetic protein FliR [Phycisphaerales bacterium]